MIAENTEDEIIIGGYKLFLDKKIGSGAFGVIYLGNHLQNKEEVAIKVECADVKNPQLEFESKLIKYLKAETGVPKVYDFCTKGEHNYMIMELLGKNLEDLLESCNRKFSLKSTILIVNQMLCRIEYLHKRNFIHRDVKPDNFLVGKNSKKNIIHMLDFGLAKRYYNPKTNKHIPYKDGKSLTGTARYASIFTHLGIEQSRRDDLESLGYIIIYFLKGELPWQGMKAKTKKEKYSKILEKKKDIDAKELYKGFSYEFVTFLEYCKNLQFEEKPDYKYLNDLLNKIFLRYGYDLDSLFDWELDMKNLQIKDEKEKDNK